MLTGVCAVSGARWTYGSFRQESGRASPGGRPIVVRQPPAVTDPTARGGAAPGGRGWRAVRTLLAGPLGPLVGGQCLGQLADGLAQITLAQFVLFDLARGATP